MSKMLEIRDGLNSWLAAIDGTGSWNTDISKPSQRINGWRSFQRIQFTPAVLLTWGREERRPAELSSRIESELFLNLLLVTKRADMSAADDEVADLQADIKNRTEVPDSGTGKGLGIATVDIKQVIVTDVDPIEIEEEQAADGFVAWNLTLLVRYRHTRGSA